MRLYAGLLAMSFVFVAPEAWSQSRTRVWSLNLPVPVSALPVEEFVTPACGTNGGPPSVKLESFGQFMRCRPETQSGLREVWFIYDDEWEFIARARRDEHEITRFSANTFYSQPVSTSLLIDAAGKVQGYRVVTDSRAPNEVRLLANRTGGAFKTMFNAAPWVCQDLPRDERDHPIDDLFIKQSCSYSDGQIIAKIEIRHRLKPGQEIGDNPRDLEETQGQFESSSSLDVYRESAVKDEPCCQASVRP